MAVGWVVIEIAFVLHGFPGVPRYLFEPAGLTAVLAGICFGWLLLDAKRYWRALPAWAGIPLALVLLVVDGPQGHRQRPRRAQGHLPRARPHQRDQQARRAHRRAGGPSASRPAGWPVLNVEYVSIMGWYLHRNTGVIGYRPKIELAKKRPDRTVHAAAQRVGGRPPTTSPRAARCDQLKSLYVPTARHPEGVARPEVSRR